MNRFIAGWCAVLFCWHAIARASDSEPAAAPANVPPEMSGSFASPDGAKVEVYQAASDEFILNVDDPGMAKIELLVRGTQAVPPVAMRASTQFGEAPMQLVGEGPELYGRTEVAGKSLEFLVDAQGAVHTAVAGKAVKTPSTSTELEAGLVAEDFAATWNAMRTMSFSLAPEGVNVRGASAPGSTQRVDRVFGRKADLSDARKEELGKVREERSAMSDSVAEFRKILA